jgi:hypothetical protein
LLSPRNQLAIKLPKSDKRKISPISMENFKFFDLYIWAKKMKFKPLEIQKIHP